MPAFAQTWRMGRVSQTWRRVTGRSQPEAEALPAAVAGREVQDQRDDGPQVELAPDDPLMAYFQETNGAVDLDTLKLESPGLEALRAAGVKLVVPLVSQGELIGLLNLGPRLSEQDYSSEDRRLLEHLADQAAPAVRVAQLVRDQAAAARQRERIEQELQVARVIQQHFLPLHVPQVPGWQVSAYYRPAREVSGDFYDFIHLPDGRLGIVIGDVTDKGVPAALVMTATQSVLRATAQEIDSPGEVLPRVNEAMCPGTPGNMFITSFYAVLDPATGRLHYANAGHDVPQVRTAAGVTELWARGMPLGLLPGMAYEEHETTLAPGDTVLFYSDGLVEAHNPAKEMFGFPRLKKLMVQSGADRDLTNHLLAELERFTGSEWEQEDDIALVTLQRRSSSGVQG